MATLCRLACPDMLAFCGNRADAPSLRAALDAVEIDVFYGPRAFVGFHIGRLGLGLVPIGEHSGHRPVVGARLSSVIDAMLEDAVSSGVSTDFLDRPSFEAWLREVAGPDGIPEARWGTNLRPWIPPRTTADLRRTTVSDHVRATLDLTSMVDRPHPHQAADQSSTFG